MDDAARVLPCGDRALLLELPGDGDVRGWAAALERSPLPGQAELVPGARTVLVRLHRQPTEHDAATLRRLRPLPTTEAGPAAELVLDVVFDGPDLAEAGGLTGRGVDGLVRVLTATRFTVAFAGFAPGFGYLTGLPADVQVPRRATPRTRVPAGAVGLAGPYAGVYPRASPGGWQLVGRTDAVLFDVDRDPPALLTPGTAVRLRAVG